jgi:hypothetical protein
MSGWWWRRAPGNNKVEKLVNFFIAVFIAYCVGTAIGLMVGHITTR